MESLLGPIASERKKHVLIATPCFGGMLTNKYVESLITMIAQYQKKMTISIQFLPNESLIPRARNFFVAEFLKNPEFTHLVFIDADVSFSGEAIHELVNSDYEISGCAYPMKKVQTQKTIDMARRFPDKTPIEIEEKLPTFVFNPCINPTNNKPEVNIDENGWMDVICAGTGFLCIQRQVLLDMISEYPELKYDNDVLEYKHLDMFTYGLFDPFIESLRYLSEDYAFCVRYNKMRKNGKKIGLNTKYELSHTGPITFTGTLLKILV